jgi:2-polyprenyl-6-methoxyphenol hydroxylase-like FAD-dependent oxidoreductase
MKTETTIKNDFSKLSKKISVLIVGAGPTGLTAAMELSRLGVNIMIIDKASGPSTTSKALAVQSRTLELLELRGLSEEMLSKGNQAVATTIYNEKKELGKVDLTMIESRYNFCLLIPQSETEGILRRKVERQEVQIQWNTEMTGFVPNEEGSGVKATIINADGVQNEIVTDCLISAEGAHSIARKLLNLHFEGKTMGQNYALGDLHVDGELSEKELSIFIGKKGFLAAFPMGNKRFRLMVTDPDNHTKNDPAPSLDELQKLYDQVVHFPAKLYDLQWSSRYGINSRMMRTLKSGNIFFGGDSAHIHSPAGGQGMNTGIQDMINLAWKLAYVIKGYGKPELLDTYEEERIPIIANLLDTTERATDMFNSINPFVYAMMSLFMPPLLKLNRIQRKGTAMISEVANDYKESKLSLGAGNIGELSAGMRLPNTGLLIHVSRGENDEIGRISTLYSLLDPSQFTLLLTEYDKVKFDLEYLKHPRITVYYITAATNEKDGFEKLFGQGSGFVLIRPDAYVAIAGNAAQFMLVNQWISNWLN